MNEETRELLKIFIKDIRISERHLNPNIFSNINDEKKVLKLAVSLLETNETFDEDDVKSVCEEVGGDEYSSLISDELFIENFANPICSRFKEVKHIIDIYRRFGDTL